MGKMSRNKGARVEREIVKKHTEAGIVARKVPLSGAMKGYPGDVVVADHFRCEVKARKNGQGFATLEKWLGENHLLFLKRDRQNPMVVMEWETYKTLMQLWGEQPDQP